MEWSGPGTWPLVAVSLIASATSAPLIHVYVCHSWESVRPGQCEGAGVKDVEAQRDLGGHLSSH